MKRVSLEELLQKKQSLSYTEQHRYICGLIEEEKIKPVKASGTNGKKPALYREYWILEKQKDYSSYIDEITYTFSPMISIDYYLAHLDIYEKDRPYVLMLNDYLKEAGDQRKTSESWNERSFEIWNREKFLDREQGKTILKRCNVQMESLNLYRTTEPLSYYTHTRKVPQNLLILENKDPFFSMRNHLLQGDTKLFDVEIGTLIYGAGKGILRSFQDFDLCAEPYMIYPQNQIFYFGDLDYEGIKIYESLAEKFHEKWKIRPFLPAYEKMLAKAKNVKKLPQTKEQQNRNIGTAFFNNFTEGTVKEIKAILEADQYIPQEILNTADF